MNNDDLSRKFRKAKLVIDTTGNAHAKKQPLRPTCTRCKREMIQAHITAGDKTFIGFLCDCFPQPATISTDIVRAREWDDEVLFYTIEYKPDGD